MPLSFHENIVKASSTPSGSYTHLSSWLNNAASKPIEFPQGLIRVIFDNEQVIGKRYRVKVNQHLVPSSIIASNIYLTIASDNFIQYDNEFNPSNWMLNTVTNSLKSSTKNSFNEYNNTFCLTRNDLINAGTNVLSKSLDCGDSEFINIVEKKDNKKVFSEK